MEKEPTFEITQNQHFRQLVEDLVNKSKTLGTWVNPTNPADKMTAIKAIERDKSLIYLGENVSNKKLDAMHCLIEIYDELEGNEPTDEEFIEETIESLKAYL